ncbi:MAG: hypothetical protein IPN26_14900 [Bacteroidetes bacterium]|nr:hypothetical protein [Bacteroidota bacterium]
MKQNNHLFDDFLKGQVEEAEVTFKEEYWQKMESLLDQEEGKKSSPWWRKGLGIVLALLAIGTSALVYKKATQPNSQEQAIAVAQGQNLDSGLDTLQNSQAEDIPNKIHLSLKVKTQQKHHKKKLLFLLRCLRCRMQKMPMEIHQHLLHLSRLDYPKLKSQFLSNKSMIRLRMLQLTWRSRPIPKAGFNRM